MHIPCDASRDAWLLIRASETRLLCGQLPLLSRGHRPAPVSAACLQANGAEGQWEPEGGESLNGRHARESLQRDTLGVTGLAEGTSVREEVGLKGRKM